jgi:hypothetical protein
MPSSLSRNALWMNFMILFCALLGKLEERESDTKISTTEDTDAHRKKDDLLHSVLLYAAPCSLWMRFSVTL